MSFYINCEQYDLKRAPWRKPLNFYKACRNIIYEAMNLLDENKYGHGNMEDLFSKKYKFFGMIDNQ